MPARFDPRIRRAPSPMPAGAGHPVPLRARHRRHSHREWPEGAGGHRSRQRPGAPAAAMKMLQNHIPSDAPEPAAERIPGPIASKCLQRGHHHRLYNWRHVRECGFDVQSGNGSDLRGFACLRPTIPQAGDGTQVLVNAGRQKLLFRGPPKHSAGAIHLGVDVGPRPPQVHHLPPACLQGQWTKLAGRRPAVQGPNRPRAPPAGSTCCLGVFLTRSRSTRRRISSRPGRAWRR